MGEVHIVSGDTNTYGAKVDSNGALHVKLDASASIDIGDVTLLAGTAEIGKLGAGTALIGKVGIDQTTPGTTNAVAANPVAATTGGYSFLNIVAGQATTVVKASAGYLRSITFNSAATATNVTTVYDHASGAGTVIAIPAVTAVTAPVTVVFDVACAAGITIITATANGGNMTVVYK